MKKKAMEGVKKNRGFGGCLFQIFPFLALASRQLTVIISRLRLLVNVQVKKG
jgi:hypothetical protein